MLRDLRKRVGLTQTALAVRTGMSQSYLAALESGRRRSPGFATLNALCDALSLTADERVELILSFAQAQPPAPTAVVADGGAPAGTPDTEQMFQVSALAGAEEAA
ncbi:MAG: helix-turn-helix transcriptional regulator [Deltaproteobacteria bacterium]|nr:helix-turn-helix transcriptional regulator [Deltaproteobacteria bacterium]